MPGHPPYALPVLTLFFPSVVKEQKNLQSKFFSYWPSAPKCQKNLRLLTTNRSFGGAERDRTADPLLAKQVLSQLSYSPVKNLQSKFLSY